MEFEVFKSGEVIATLTTESCRSSYGIPVLRIEGPGYGSDFGPADVVENALAADVIFWLFRHPGRGEASVCLSGWRQPPPQDEITLLIEVLKGHKGEILNDPCLLIEQTLQTINGEWKTGAAADGKTMIILEATPIQKPPNSGLSEEERKE